MDIDDERDPLTQGFEAIAKGLNEFGYPSINAEMIKTAYVSWKRGDSPVSVIDHFAFKDFEQHPKIFGQPELPSA